MKVIPISGFYLSNLQSAMLRQNQTKVLGFRILCQTKIKNQEKVVFQVKQLDVHNDII